MSKIVHSIEIARSPEDVFAYIDQLERHGEWQSQIVSTRRETDGPTRVGTRATDVRRVPGAKQSVTYEITEHEPPRKASFKGVNGPVRPVGTVTVEPAGESRSKVTLELDLHGHGLLGMVFAPLARSQSRKLYVPMTNHQVYVAVEADDANAVREFTFLGRLGQWNTIEIYQTSTLEEALTRVEELPTIY